MSDETKLMKKFISGVGFTKEYNKFKKINKKNFEVKKIQLGLNKKKNK